MPRINGKRLNGRQLERFSKALRAAFRPRTIEQLDMLLTYRLDRSISDYTTNAAVPIAVFDLLQHAEAEAWTAELLVAALDSRPDNPELREFAYEMEFSRLEVQNVSPDVLEGFRGTAGLKDTLERNIKPLVPYLDPDKFRRRMGEVEGWVCQIEYASDRGNVSGTGFLVNRDVVITNYHVLEPVIRTALGQPARGGVQVEPSAVGLRFDFKMIADGTVLSEGQVHRLAEGADWLLDQSPYSRHDLEVDRATGTPRDDELDYALVRLAEPVGDLPIGPRPEPTAPPRGWVRPRPLNHFVDADFVAGKPLLIAQHPLRRPLKVVLGMEGLIGRNESGTRLKYTTNTEQGSSGSPCFDANWELLAMHHAGDPNFDAFQPPGYNEGIPFDRILALLKARDKDGLLQ